MFCYTRLWFSSLPIWWRILVFPEAMSRSGVYVRRTFKCRGISKNLTLCMGVNSYFSSKTVGAKPTHENWFASKLWVPYDYTPPKTRVQLDHCTHFDAAPGMLVLVCSMCVSLLLLVAGQEWEKSSPLCSARALLQLPSVCRVDTVHSWKEI